MKKWYDEEFEFEIEVTGFLRSDHTEHYCRNGEEIGDKYTCTYGCPVNNQGYGICSKMMQILFADMQAVRSGGDLMNVGGSEKYIKDYVCPDGCVCFKMTVNKTENVNFYKGNFFQK
ncbi:MAG: TIGR04076 family protein [Firmicutes bacterium HGW-Firmicutes-4]|jgi:uncharacterized repeat protein (TIGR04076 family)|nr:MAG: TIGR04076 family protein [Firmicutes bacterium HGW-Firmicutes-4]